MDKARRPCFPLSTGWPEIDAEAMALVDRLMMNSFLISLTQMMENAGRSLATVARHRFLSGDTRGRRVAVLAGTGGNGGGALTAARRLANGGADVSVVLTREASAIMGVPGQEHAILERMGVRPVTQLPGPVDLVVDGLIGYSLVDAPHGRAAQLIEWANAQSAPVLALDVPSGFQAASGTIPGLAVRAAATLTLAFPKRGLLSASAAPHVGEVYLADISVPPALYRRLPVPPSVPTFSESDIVRLLRPGELEAVQEQSAIPTRQ